MELGQLAPNMSDFDSLQVFDGLLGDGHHASAFDVDVDCFSDETVSATSSDGDAGASEHDEPKTVERTKPNVGDHARQRSTSYDWMSSVSPLMGSAGGFGVKSTTPLMEGLVLGPGAKAAPIKLGPGMWVQQQQQQQGKRRGGLMSGNKRARMERGTNQSKSAHMGGNSGSKNNSHDKINGNPSLKLGNGNPMIMGAIKSILSTGDPVAAQEEAERLGLSARKKRRVTVLEEQRQKDRQQQHRARYLDGSLQDQGESSETSEDTDDDAVLSFSSSITASVPFFGMDHNGDNNAGRVTPTPDFRLSLGASPSMSPMRGDMLPHGHSGMPLKNLADVEVGTAMARRTLNAKERMRAVKEKEAQAKRVKAQRERERREKSRRRERQAREKRRARDRERRERERERKKEASTAAQKERARKKRERDAAARQRKRSTGSAGKSSRASKPGRMIPSGILLSADSLKLKLMLAKNLDLRIMSEAGCITPPADLATPPSALSPRVALESPGAPRVGVYTPEERLAMVARFRTKRQARIWRKKIKYSCRKKLADSRPRIKGRFVKRLPGEEPQTVARAEAKLAEMARQRAEAAAAAKAQVVSP